ncbi:MAG: c-type cytochrome [Deltaproteobacteria bacterium]|nr:c-type cytochrome [Deltaproteobacteria bacterium]
MSDAIIQWLPGIIVLFAGLAAGLYVAAIVRRDTPPAAAPDLDLDDLESRRENLIALLRDLETERHMLDPAIYATQKAELEAKAVEVTRLRDTIGQGGGVSAKTGRQEPTAAVRFLASRPRLAGVIWGSGAVAVIAAIYLVMSGRPTTSPRTSQPVAAPAPPSLSAAGRQQIGEIMAALQQNPGDIDALLRGSQVMVREGQTVGARAFVDRALQLDPEHPEALVAYATLLAAQGDAQGGLNRLDALVVKKPDYLPAHFVRGMLAAELHDDARMQQSLKRFVDKAPDGPQKSAALAALAGAKPAEAAATVSQLWATRCSLCHGVRGGGDTTMGKSMGLADMASAAWQQRLSDDAIRRVIREGVLKEEAGRKKRMQAFPELSAAQVDELVKTVRAFKSP